MITQYHTIIMVRQHLDDALTQETLPAVDGTIFNNIITLTWQHPTGIVTSSQSI